MYWIRCAVLLVFSTLAALQAIAQKADVAFVGGGSIVSGSKENFLCVAGVCAQQKFQTGNQFTFQGVGAYRVAHAGPAWLYLELPVVQIPSQRLTVSQFCCTLGHITTSFVTPSVRAKLLPKAPISPFLSFGAGWARYSFHEDVVNKGALQYGGGLDVRTMVPHLGMRFEVRDFVTANPDFFRSSLFSAAQANSPGPESGLHHHNVIPGGGLVFSF